MKLSELIKEERIVIEMRARTPADALTELVGHLGDEEIEVERRGELVEELIARESSSPSLLNSSIWLPHLRSSIVREACICVGISPEGIPMPSGSGDGTPAQAKAQLIFLVLTPEMENTRMLQTLSAIARLCTNRDTVEAILHVRTPHRAVRVVAESGIEVRKRVLVRDVMEPSPASLREDMTLREATEHIARSGVDACPVVGEKGELIGEVRVSDLIRLGLPEYIDFLEDTGFVETLEPFENFFRQERQLRVEQVYTPDVLKIEADRTVVEAAHKLVTANRTHLYVVQENKLIGLLTQSSILRKILLL